jgi:tetratricopeptide (TPR) repeat protein
MSMNSAVDPFSGTGRLPRSATRRHAMLLAVLTAAVPHSAAAVETLARQWAWCRGDDDDLEIRGCSAVIRSGRDPPEQLARAFANRGRAWSEKGDYDRAMHDFDNAIRLAPDFPDAFNYRGVANVNQGQYDQAIQDFGQAIQLDPNLAIAIYNRGLALQAQGHADEAAKDFARAKQVGPRLTAPK